MQKYLKYFLIVAIIVFVVPQITLAAWWNPFSWGFWNIFFHKQTPVNEINETSKFLGDKSNWDKVKIENVVSFAAGGTDKSSISGNGQVEVEKICPCPGPGKKEIRNLSLSKQEANALLETFVKNNFLALTSDKQPGGIGAGLIEIILFNQDGQSFKVSRYNYWDYNDNRWNNIYDPVNRIIGKTGSLGEITVECSCQTIQIKTDKENIQNFLNIFTQKVLDKKVSFSNISMMDRVDLENAAGKIANTQLKDQWQKFTKANGVGNKQEIATEQKNLLDLISSLLK